jgi:hypothetical protein
LLRCFAPRPLTTALNACLRKRYEIRRAKPRSHCDAGLALLIVEESTGSHGGGLSATARLAYKHASNKSFDLSAASKSVIVSPMLYAAPGQLGR